MVHKSNSMSLKLGILISLCALLLLGSGCSSEDSSTNPPKNDIPITKDTFVYKNDIKRNDIIRNDIKRNENNISTSCASVCKGCCNGEQCMPGTTNDACGKSGSACSKCSSESMVCDLATSTCKIQTQGPCDNKPDKTPCTENGINGKCWYDLTTAKYICCTGCYDSDLVVNSTKPKCYTSISDLICGKEGSACDNCNAKSAACDLTTGTCLTSSCINKTGGSAPCIVSGKIGTCWNDACCTGCYDMYIGSKPACYTTTTNTYCGIKGSACEDCTSKSSTCNLTTGTCK